LGTVTTTAPAIFELNVDVNGNSNPDVLKLDADSVNFALDAIDFDDLTIDDSVLADLLAGNNVATTIDGALSITAATVVLDGAVLDVATDPPFTLNLSGSVGSTAVPIPAAGWLFGSALGGLAARRRRLLSA
ncbi:MAG: VPLPA-CTERM sorting domain-containing protein, partial [Gammaproteobacteria bacterium]